jgi:hypothetical protein
MSMPQYRACPGCGVRLPLSDGWPDARANASAECWQLYGELTAYTVTRGYDTFIHQLAVDSYGAQHARENGPLIGLAFALIGLHLTYEKGYSGRQVQHMHVHLARRSTTWPRFTPPPQVGALTVQDVLRAPPGEERDEMLRQWGRAVWEAWGQEHAQVAALIASVMGD